MADPHAKRHRRIDLESARSHHAQSLRRAQDGYSLENMLSYGMWGFGIGILTQFFAARNGYADRTAAALWIAGVTAIWTAAAPPAARWYHARRLTRAETDLEELESTDT